MRIRLTIILLIANIALFGVFFFLDGNRGADTLGGSDRSVFGSEVVDLDHIEIRFGQTGEKRVLRKEQNNWFLQEPSKWPANIFAVNRIIQQIESLERVTSFRVSDLHHAGQTLEQYGLEEPDIVMVFGRGDIRHEVRVGEVTDIGNQLYIMSPCEEWIHVVPRSLAEALSLSLAELRSDTVFHIQLHEARSLNLQLGAHARIRIARSADYWNFETPFQTRADRTAVETAITRLNRLRIRRFIEPAGDLAAYGLNNPSMRVTLDGNSRRETLLVGNDAPIHQTGPEVFAKLEGNPTVFTIPADPLRPLERAQDLLRDRNLLRFDRARVSSINISAGARGEILLQKLETNQWQIVSRFSDGSIRFLPADAAIVERLIDSLEWADVVHFENDAPSDADLARYGFQNPQRIVTLGGSDIPMLHIGNHAPHTEGREIYAKLDNSRFVYTIDTSLLRELPVRTIHFRDRILLRQPDGALLMSVRILDVETEDVLFEIALPSADVTWEKAVEGRPDKEREAILALLPELRNLRAQRYLIDGFGPVFEYAGRELGFRYRLDAELLLVGGESSRNSRIQLYLTDLLSPQSVIAGSPEHGVIFAVHQALVDALNPILYARPPAEPPAAGNVES